MNVVGSLFSLSHSLFFGIAGLFGIGFIIGFHEFGHFLFCKIFKVRTPSFSIGFGPRLITKKIGDTEFALSAIPLGGYVEIAGAAEVGQGEQKDAHARDEQSFAAKPWPQKFMIMFGGILFNLIFAYVTFSLLFMAGMPKSMMLYPKNATPTLALVAPNSPAEQAGLKAGDKLITVDGNPVTAESIQSQIKSFQQNPEKTMNLRIDRDGQEQDITLTVGPKNFLGNGTIGAYFETTPLPGLSFVDSIYEGIKLAHHQIAMTVYSFKHIFAKGDTSMIGGPVMIIAETAKGAQSGFKTFLLFLAYISISLAVLNLLPLPILDGGQILFYTIEAITGRQIPDKVREYIHIACWVAFLVLALFLSYKDLKSLLSPYISNILSFIGLSK